MLLPVHPTEGSLFALCCTHTHTHCIQPQPDAPLTRQALPAGTHFCVQSVVCNPCAILFAINYGRAQNMAECARGAILRGEMFFDECNTHHTANNNKNVPLHHQISAHYNQMKAKKNNKMPPAQKHSPCTSRPPPVVASRHTKHRSNPLQLVLQPVDLPPLRF